VPYALMNLTIKNILPFILFVFCIFSIQKSWSLENYVGELFKTDKPINLYAATQAKEGKANNKKINSQKLKLPSGKILKNQNRKLFEVTRIKLDVLKSELIMGLN
jgi:hypothetical protein